MKRIEVRFGKLVLIENVIGFFQKNVTRFDPGAKIYSPKEFLGKTVYVIVCSDKAK